MNRKRIFFIVLIVVSINNLSKAQSNKVGDKKYSVVMPEDYQPIGKSYPLVVCYQNKDTDSLFQYYAKHSQVIILQLDNASATIWSNDSLKAIIHKTMQACSVAKDKIYLLGVNENIRKTLEIYTALNYYFAATAYITSNLNTYKLLSDTLKLNNSIQLHLVDLIDDNTLNTVHKQFLQHYLWEFNMEKMSEDAIALHVVSVPNDKYNWQISLSFGQWHFNNSAKARENAIINFPQKTSIWNLSCARVLSEHVSVNANLGVLFKKIKPEGINIFSILAGDSLDIEGGGILFMPISVGVDYFFLKKRFRPYAGFGFGLVPVKYKYVEGSGSLSNGINRNEREFKNNAPFVEFSSGFVYRTGKNLQLGLNGDYIRSKSFSENIGSYSAFNGFRISVVLGVVF